MRGRENAFGFPLTDEIVPATSSPGARRSWTAIAKAMPGARVRHARGTGISEGSDEELAAAVELVRSQRVAILVLGERSGLTDEVDDGRVPRPPRPRADRPPAGAPRGGRGDRDARRPGRRQRPSARARMGRSTLRRDPARVGPRRGGPGPSLPPSRAPQTRVASCRYPCLATSARCPVSYRHHPTGGRSNPKGDYVDGPATPLWPFGFGRSYTTFELADLELERSAIPTDGSQDVVVRVSVRNTGELAGDEVVQLYARDEAATVARPVLELRGFRRVSLAPGEGEPCRSGSRPSSSRTSAPTTGGSSSPAPSACSRAGIDGPAVDRGPRADRSNDRTRRPSSVPDRDDARLTQISSRGSPGRR